ncbi:coiled-coil domain-containing protein 74A-like [Tubulanus polymorphus]|uniref:coiled-coil domain-containing protein 74A-like n=1 Tax=Tubulanus polymorphus TaxID=672921 RepID=UPI003DA36F99
MNPILVQETVPLPSSMDINQQLPPLQQQMPQWSRVGALDKARYPKPFLKDRLQPLPPTNDNSSVKTRENSADSSERSIEIKKDLNASSSRVQHLERSILFLKQQHCDILSSLHQEIDTLKKENKELQFQLVMVQKLSPPASAKQSSRHNSAKGNAKEQKRSSAVRRLPPVEKISSAGSSKKNVEVRAVYLDDEIKQLKFQLKEAQNKNAYLKQLLDEQNKNIIKESIERKAIDGPVGEFGGAGAASAPDVSHIDLEGEGTEHMDITTNPITINSMHTGSRKPTTAEYEAMIRYLHGLNQRQNNELMQLKTDLKDVIYSQKWTPDAYLLAKAYIAEDEDIELAEKNHLPKVPMKHATRKLPNVAYAQRDNASLPALKQTLGNKAAERRKRTQILQKARLKKEIL